MVFHSTDDVLWFSIENNKKKTFNLIVCSLLSPENLEVLTYGR